MDARLTALEEKISRVAALCEGLRAENASLHAQLAEALKTRDEYGKQMDAARIRLEALAAKLPGA
jgi:chromosome segregation ATPase